MRQKNNSTIVWIGAKTKYTGKQNVEVLNVQEDNINKIERKDRQFHYTFMPGCMDIVSGNPFV